MEKPTLKLTEIQMAGQPVAYIKKEHGSLYSYALEIDTRWISPYRFHGGMTRKEVSELLRSEGYNVMTYDDFIEESYQRRLYHNKYTDSYSAWLSRNCDKDFTITDNNKPSKTETTLDTIRYLRDARFRQNYAFALNGRIVLDGAYTKVVGDVKYLRVFFVEADGLPSPQSEWLPIDTPVQVIENSLPYFINVDFSLNSEENLPVLFEIYWCGANYDPTFTMGLRYNNGTHTSQYHSLKSYTPSYSDVDDLIRTLQHAQKLFVAWESKNNES